jgi:GNAT superfamily N-acetyltransferase
VSDYQFHPATADRWPHIEELFGERGACGGCWCMAWRKPNAEFQRDKGAANRESLQTLLNDTAPPPGILAYSDGKAVGWCAVAPRPQYVRLEKSRVLRPLDNAPVWSVSCFFVEKKFRRKGLSVELLKAATQFVKDQGGSILEGYPILPGKGKMPDVFAWTGLLSAFLKAGFQEMPRWSENRPIVRYTIS